MDIALWVQLGLFAVLLGFSGFFSSSETAFFSLDSRQLDRLEKSGSKQVVLIRKLLSRPRRLIVTILIGNELVNVAASNISASLLLRFVAEEDMWWVNISIMLPLLLLLGEITPKTLAVRNNVGFSVWLSGPIHMFARMITPVRNLVRFVADLFITMIVGPRRSRGNIITEDMVRTLANEAADAGELDAMERQTIHNIFDFGNHTVEEIMTSSTRLVCLPLDAPLDLFLSTFREARLQRVPVYHTNPENIIGFLHYRDLLRPDVNTLFENNQLVSILRQPYFIPKTKPSTDLFHDFLVKKRSIALVLDEQGDIIGVATMEDLLTSIFGDLAVDRREAPAKPAQQLGDGCYRLEGRMQIARFNQEVGCDLPLSAKTMGGLVMHSHGELPEVGSKVMVDDFELTVLEMSGRSITQIQACSKHAVNTEQEINLTESAEQVSDPIENAQEIDSKENAQEIDSKESAQEIDSKENTQETDQIEQEKA
ncbi:MAG: HlyC/CorC family transporter [Magnetococcales bacterium]|nr:HlyC/CorC family transporter [Magnetococcales bacterium]